MEFMDEQLPLEVIMMTDAQRYLFDMMGYLHLEQALKRTELKAAQQAINRYVNAADNADKYLEVD